MCCGMGGYTGGRIDRRGKENCHPIWDLQHLQWEEWRTWVRTEVNGGKKIDLEVFQETEETDGIHTRASARYRVLAADVPGRNQGGSPYSTTTPPNFKSKITRRTGRTWRAFRWCAVAGDGSYPAATSCLVTRSGGNVRNRDRGGGGIRTLP